MVSVGFGAFTGMIMVLAAVTLPMLAVWGLVKLLSGLGWVLGGIGRGVGGFVGRIVRFVRSEIRDALQMVGGLLTAVVIAPLALLNVVIGRWSAAGHYGRALEDEIASSGLSLYRLALGNPIQLLGLAALTDGLERRLPDVVQRVPVREPSKGKKRGFTGYQVLGTLPSGGSGAKLYLARPSRDKVLAFQAAGHTDPGQVVIKSFALEEGSTLPQIVRESRALECASRLGLVLEHELEGGSFHYVMPFVPGERLDEVTRRMHERTPNGLDRRQLSQVLAFTADLLHSLDRFHSGGLWHKDIKPSNIIVSGHKVQLVDLGLVTPLQSAMTLTTHGTEYYRDPEMVRLALNGVKVHEVEGAKFDIYSVGAVLFSMLENDFPAHGNLSRLTKPCPDALAMIVRRAMADMGTRYGSAREMLEDLRVLLRASDPAQVRVADLPSMGGRRADREHPAFRAAAGGSYDSPAERIADARAGLAAASAGGPGAAPAFAAAAASPADSLMGAGAPVRSSRARAPRRASNVLRALSVGTMLAALFVIGLAFTARSVRETGVHRVPAMGVPQPPLIAISSESDSAPVRTHRLQVGSNGQIRFETETHSGRSNGAAVVVPPAPTRIAGHVGSVVDAIEDHVDAAIGRLESASRADRSEAPRAAQTTKQQQREGARAERRVPVWAKPFDRLPDGATVLVLRDVRARGTDFETDAIRETLEALGLNVLDADSTGEDSELERELGADALSVIGLGTPDEPEVVERLREHIDSEARLDALYWLWSGPDGPHPVALVDRTPETPLAAR